MIPVPNNKPTEATASRLSHAGAEGCAESRLTLSRRSMLGITAGLFSSAFMPRFAEAAGGGDPRLLVVILRGGMDGLSTVVPYGDSSYVSMRGELAIPAASTTKLDSFFGLHPALRNFAAFYKAGDAAIVHATCVPLRNRSHFDAQDNLENGLPGLKSNTTGWLNRVLTALPAGEPIRSKGAIQIGQAPLLLRGTAPVLGWSPTSFGDVEEGTLNAIRMLYKNRDPQLLTYLDRGLKAKRFAEGLGSDPRQMSDLHKGFSGAGRMLAAQDGPRVAVLSVDGWDTHTEQGAAQGGLADLLRELDDGLAYFKGTAGAIWSKTVVLIVTEFGRTVRNNGNHGSDHGVATVALLAGGAVNGGRVIGDWPGLAAKNLYDGRDLRPTTDLRSIFKGVLRDHLGVPDAIINKTAFPESAIAPPLRDLIKA
ncbi:MAG: DUF1501 domain-containing protein [Rhizobiales bacterium]|nr:DUF1501 domain-containing protein [Hyphomicrobiales bacterium]